MGHIPRVELFSLHIVLFVISVIVQGTSEQDYKKPCEECIAKGLSWIVDDRCAVDCRDLLPSGPGWNKNLYRSIANSSDGYECSKVKYCAFVEDVRDGSFEDGLWTVSKSFSSNYPVCTNKSFSGDDDKLPVPADGTHFLSFGDNNGPSYQSVHLDNVIFPKNATHLSLFFSPNTIPSTSQDLPTTCQDFFVAVNGTIVLHLFDLTIMWKFYHNIDIDIRRFADEKPHTIQLISYIDRPGDKGSMVVDHLRFIQDTTLKNNWPEFAQLGESFHGACPEKLLEDGSCHPKCNVIQYNYSNDACKSASNERGKCYNSETPLESRYFFMCTDYRESSCCSTFDLFLIWEKFYNLTNSCEMSDHCRDNIEKAVCAYCSPNNKNFITNGFIQFSNYFRDGLYSSCKSSSVNNNGTCVKIGTAFSNADLFIQLFGNAAEYGFNDLAFDSSSTGLAIGLSIAGVFLVAAVVVIVFLVLRYSKKNDKKSGVVEIGDEEKIDGIVILLNGVRQKLSIIKEIGKGSYGTVWLAEAGSLKIAAKEVGKTSEDNDEGYKKEMELMMELRSPYVVRVYGCITSKISKYILMEYLPLGSLSSVMEKNCFSAYMRIRFMFEVARGMEYLHSQGIIHRDLKPANVLVSSVDVNSQVLCKITDFGVSRKGSAQTETAVMTRGVGSPYYMSPEMLRGEDKYTRTVDVYSFGITCAELWNEELPYSEAHFDTLLAFVMYVVDGKRPAVREDCPGDLLALMVRCWAQDRNDRPSFADVSSALSTIVNNMVVTISPDTQHVQPRVKKEMMSVLVTQEPAPELNDQKDDHSPPEDLSLDGIPLDDLI